MCGPTGWCQMVAERMKHMEATYKKPDAQLFITNKNQEVET